MVEPSHCAQPSSCCLCFRGPVGFISFPFLFPSFPPVLHPFPFEPIRFLFSLEAQSPHSFCCPIDVCFPRTAPLLVTGACNSRCGRPVLPSPFAHASSLTTNPMKPRPSGSENRRNKNRARRPQTPKHLRQHWQNVNATMPKCRHPLPICRFNALRFVSFACLRSTPTFLGHQVITSAAKSGAK